MNIKCAFAAAALAFAGSASATNTFAGHHFDHFDVNKHSSNTFASQSKSKKHFQNWDVYVRYDEWGNSHTVSSYSVPDWKWKGHGHNHVTPPVPEPETYALMIAGLLVVFFVARRRRERS